MPELTDEVKAQYDVLIDQTRKRLHTAVDLFLDTDDADVAVWAGNDVNTGMRLTFSLRAKVGALVNIDAEPKSYDEFGSPVTEAMTVAGVDLDVASAAYNVVHDAICDDDHGDGIKSVEAALRALFGSDFNLSEPLTTIDIDVNKEPYATALAELNKKATG